MTIFWNILTVLVLHPIFGTLMYAVMEKSSIPKKWKILLLTFGHPVITCLAVWILLSLFNRDTTTALFFMVGVLLRSAFSNSKYFVKLDRTEKEISINYISPLLRNRIIIIPVSRIQNSSVSTAKGLYDKPSIYNINLTDETIRFYVLDQVTKGLSLV